MTGFNIPGKHSLPVWLQSAQTPGTWDRSGHGDPNTKTCQQGDTPSSVGLNDFGDPTSRPMAQIACTILPLDLNSVDRLFRSVGVARALSMHTRSKWVSDGGDALVLTLCAAAQLVDFATSPSQWSFSGVKNLITGEVVGPGHVEVQTVSRETIDTEANAEASRLAEHFIAKICPAGPEKAMAYLDGLVAIRESYLKTVEQVFSDAQQLNQDIINANVKLLKNLKIAKAGSTLILAPASLVSGPVGAGLYFGYELVIAYTDNADGGASAIAFGTEEKVGGAAKEVVEETAEQVVEKVAAGAEKEILKGGKHADRISGLRDLIAKYETKLDRVGAKKAAKLQTRIRLRSKEVSALQKSAARQPGNVLKKLAGRLNFVFVAKDMSDAFNDLVDAINENE